MTLVALSASYGAGGSRIGPALAERLGVDFVDRAIPLAVAEQLDVSVDEAAAHEDQRGGRWFERLLRGFIGGDDVAPTAVPAQLTTSHDFRRATEEVILRHAATGSAVILGRGAVIVLRRDPRVLRVRLDGPPERRIRQAMRLRGLEREVAERALRETDRAHADYARQFYGVDIADPALYHLVLDSTAMPLEACVDLVCTAAEVLAGVPSST